MGTEQPDQRLEVRDLVAALDQANAALADVAKVLSGYREQLVANGFDSDEALELCIEVQRGLIFKEPDDPDA